MTTLTAIQAHELIATKAPAISDKKSLEKLDIGKGIRQGDLYIIRIKDSGETKIKQFGSINPSECTLLGSDQLVTGTSMGSRHTIKESQASFYTNPKNSNPVFGGIVKARTSWDLEHPEHAHWNLPRGTYAVFYQLDWATKERVKD
jgi:hypothetical protein